MTKAPRRSAAIAAALMTVTLTGCGGEDDVPRGLLTEEDVSDTRLVRDTREDTGLPVCHELAMAELKLTFDNGIDSHRRFTLRNGDVLGTSVLALAPQYESAAEALETIDAGLDGCATSLLDGEAIERIPDLDAGMIGYRSSTTTSSNKDVLTRVFAPHGDHIVIVGIESSGDQGVATVTSYMHKALERADELDG
jgi:hypothetical protein